MKLKTLLTTTFAMVSVYAFAYTTDTETKLRHLVGEIISLNTSTWSDDKIISIDTLWIKPIKDKRKAKKGKHYTIHIETKFIKEFSNKKFYVQEVKDELEIYLINTETPHGYLVWKPTNCDNLLVYIDSKSQLKRSQFVSKEFYVYTNRNFTAADYRGYTQIQCTDYKFAYKKYYSDCDYEEYEEITYIDEHNVTHTCDKKDIITPDRYAQLKQNTLSKLKAEGTYTFVLSKIEKPKNPTIRYGKFQEVKTEDVISKYLYEDNVISILWYGTKEDFIFLLKNKSENSLKIVWDEASFINEENGASRIVHKGVSKARLNEMQPPTVVPKGTELNDMIVPVDRMGDYLIDSIDKRDPKRDGKDVKILLPIEIKGVINEYIFTFNLVWKCKYPELQ